LLNRLWGVGSLGLLWRKSFFYFLTMFFIRQGVLVVRTACEFGFVGCALQMRTIGGLHCVVG